MRAPRRAPARLGGPAGAEGTVTEGGADSVTAWERAGQVPTYLQTHIALHCSSTGYCRRLLDLIARLADPVPGDAGAVYLHGPRVADLASAIGCSTRYVTTLLGQLNAEPRDGHAVMLRAAGGMVQ